MMLFMVVDSRTGHGRCQHGTRKTGGLRFLDAAMLPQETPGHRTRGPGEPPAQLDWLLRVDGSTLIVELTLSLRAQILSLVLVRYADKLNHDVELFMSSLRLLVQALERRVWYV